MRDYYIVRDPKAPWYAPKAPQTGDDLFFTTLFGGAFACIIGMFIGVAGASLGLDSWTSEDGVPSHWHFWIGGTLAIYELVVWFFGQYLPRKWPGIDTGSYEQRNAWTAYHDLDLSDQLLAQPAFQAFMEADEEDQDWDEVKLLWHKTQQAIYQRRLTEKRLGRGSNPLKQHALQELEAIESGTEEMKRNG